MHYLPSFRPQYAVAVCKFQDLLYAGRVERHTVLGWLCHFVVRTKRIPELRLL